MNPQEEIKAKLLLEDVVGETVALKPAGRGKLKGLCPFHNEKSPSFQVDTHKGLYHCFSCHASGDLFTFVQNTQGLEFLEARDLLAARVGVVVPERSAHRSTKGLAELQNFAQAHFVTSLETNKAALDYLAYRGFTPATIGLWGFGYAPSGRDGLTHHAKREGVTMDALVEAGLAKRTDDGRTAEMFRDRLTIPILDIYKRIVGFTARTLKDGVQPKYLNTPETDLCEKSTILFGLAHGRRKIHDSKKAVLVEGQLDVIACHQAGIQTVVGAQSSSLSDAQINALERLGVEKLYLAYDPDEAGQKATLRGLDNVARRFKVFVGRLPGEDPAELVQRDPKAFDTILEHAVPELEYRVVQAFDGLDDQNPQDRQRILERLKLGMKDLREIYDPVAFELRQMVAKRFGIDEMKLKAWANSGPKTRAPGIALPQLPNRDVVNTLRLDLASQVLAKGSPGHEALMQLRRVSLDDDILTKFCELCAEHEFDVKAVLEGLRETPLHGDLVGRMIQPSCYVKRWFGECLKRYAEATGSGTLFAILQGFDNYLAGLPEGYTAFDRRANLLTYYAASRSTEAEQAAALAAHKNELLSGELLPDAPDDALSADTLALYLARHDLTKNLEACLVTARAVLGDSVAQAPQVAG